MYSNNSDAIKEALCFFMDEERGHMISFVQYPQNYDNITKNDIYSNVAGVLYKVGIQTYISFLKFPEVLKLVYIKITNISVTMFLGIVTM